jgi:hypothetical protein
MKESLTQFLHLEFEKKIFSLDKVLLNSKCIIEKIIEMQIRKRKGKQSRPVGFNLSTMTPQSPFRSP